MSTISKWGGVKGNIAPMRAQLRKHLELDPPTKLEDNVYLGMRQSSCVIPQTLIQEKHDLFKQLFLQNQPTDGGNSDRSTMQVEKVQKKNANDIKGYQYDLTGNVKESVQRYLKFSGKKESDLKPVPTPCLDDHQLPPEDFETKGELSADASRIVLQCMWAGRLTRSDTRWSINTLS